MKMYRQGDILIVERKSIPNGKKTKRERGNILDGETTGHVHRVDDIEAADVLEIGEGLYLNVSENGVSIIHEEHAPIMLPEGIYEVIRQREYSPEAIRNVQD